MFSSYPLRDSWEENAPCSGPVKTIKGNAAKNAQKRACSTRGERDILRPQILTIETTMADIANKYAENTGGKYYVDNQCIDCDLCRETAPENFTRNDDGGYSYVFKQPETPEQEAQCKEAKEGCPVEAIGDNGA
jgi:ferredoxin